MDVSVNDARECVTNAATVEEMLAKEVFAFRPVKTSHYVVLHYADIVCVNASNNNSVFHMADGSSFTVGRKLEVVEKFLRESPCGGFVRVNRSTPFHLPRCILYFHRYCSILSSVFYIFCGTGTGFIGSAPPVSSCSNSSAYFVILQHVPMTVRKAEATEALISDGFVYDKNSGDIEPKSVNMFYMPNGSYTNLMDIKTKGRTAILTIRPVEYSKRDLNPHSHHWPKDFKSFVSTDSTIRAMSGKRDSNSRPQPWQGCALPTELFPQNHTRRYAGPKNLCKVMYISPYDKIFHLLFAARRYDARAIRSRCKSGLPVRLSSVRSLHPPIRIPYWPVGTK